MQVIVLCVGSNDAADMAGQACNEGVDGLSSAERAERVQRDVAHIVDQLTLLVHLVAQKQPDARLIFWVPSLSSSLFSLLASHSFSYYIFSLLASSFLLIPLIMD